MHDSRKTKLGWFLILFPLPLLVGTLSLYAIAAFVISSLATSGNGSFPMQIVGFSVGIIALIGVLGIFFGIPAGIFLLVSRTPKALEQQPAAMTQNAQDYRSARAFAKTTTGFLIAFSIAASLDVIAKTATIGYLKTLAMDATIPISHMTLGLGAWSTIAFLLFIPCSIGFLCWSYRSYRNLAAISNQEPAYSPAWTIAGFVIPFVNFVIPLLIMKEIVQKSKAHVSVALLGIWWGTFLLAGITSEFVSATNDSTHANLVAVGLMSAISAVVWDVGLVLSAVALVVIINEVVKAQERLAQH